MSAVGYDLRFAIETIWKVALASLILGAGLPILFAAGVRSLAWGSGALSRVATAGAGGGAVEISRRAKPNPAGKVLAAVIFLVVAYAVVSGIVYIVATGKGSGYDITFTHVIPQIDKKAS